MPDNAITALVIIDAGFLQAKLLASTQSEGIAATKVNYNPSQEEQTEANQWAVWVMQLIIVAVLGLVRGYVIKYYVAKREFRARYDY